MAGIYLHIPFCKKLCYYCDFYHLISKGDNSEYLSSLLNEIKIRQDYLGEEIISTIYLGGGTPSVLSINELDKILNQIFKLYVVDNNCEITIELNPDDISKTYLAGLRKLKINRISMGIQSWNDTDLKMLNRRHDSAQAASALKETIKAGFENITIDLIYGLPGMSTDNWKSNLDISFSYDIKHLSAYHLTIEKGTVFGKMLEKGLLSEIDEEKSLSFFNVLAEKAESAGFIQYEISNFAKPGFFSVHNSNYWKQVNYVGFGPSAHSFNGYSRQWNFSDLEGYIKSVNSGKSFYEREELDSNTRFNEYIMTSLRTIWGIDMDYIEKIYDKEGYDYVNNLANKFKEYGLIKQDNKNLVLTSQGMMISDNIISEFMIPKDE